MIDLITAKVGEFMRWVMRYFYDKFSTNILLLY